MGENEETTNEAATAEKNTAESVENTDKKEVKETKEMSVKGRKITGVVIMALGAIIAVVWSPMAGMMIFLAGMWAYNPEVKDNSDSTIVPTWLGTLIIIVVVLLVSWLYKNFVM